MHLRFLFQAEDGIRDYKVTGVQTCALPISRRTTLWQLFKGCFFTALGLVLVLFFFRMQIARSVVVWFGVISFGLLDRKSTRLNSSHLVISYAVFCLKKKKHKYQFLVIHVY